MKSCPDGGHCENESEIEDLRQQVAQLKAVLKKAEWGNTDRNGFGYCPVCEHSQSYGHVDCALSLVLYGDADYFTRAAE